MQLTIELRTPQGTFTGCRRDLTAEKAHEAKEMLTQLWLTAGRNELSYITFDDVTAHPTHYSTLVMTGDMVKQSILLLTTTEE